MELDIIIAIQSISNSVLDNLFKIITFFGEQYFIIAVISFIYWCSNKEKGEFLIYSIITSTVLNSGIKGLVHRSRPIVEATNSNKLSEFTQQRAETATGYSFPSGHSQNASSFMTSVCLVFKKKWLYTIGGIFILLVGFSRIYLGAHYPTDVVFGILFGIVSSFVCYYFFKKAKSKLTLFIITAVCFLPLFIFFFNVPIVEGQPDMMDFYKSYGLLWGFILGYYIEHKFVNFSCDNLTLSKKIIRYLLGLLILGVIYAVLKITFPATYLFGFLRYFIITLVAIGFYPIIIKKIKI